MGFYRIRRNVVYSAQLQNTVEAWGIDRPAPGLCYVQAPRDTNRDDPINGNQDKCCCVLLLLIGRDWVTWDLLPEWLSIADEAGYELASGYEKLSPYSTLILRTKCRSLLPPP